MIVLLLILLDLLVLTVLGLLLRHSLIHRWLSGGCWVKTSGAVIRHSFYISDGWRRFKTRLDAENSISSNPEFQVLKLEDYT